MSCATNREQRAQVHRIFIGYDPRQAVSFTALVHSIVANAKEPVAITPLVLDTLPLKRQGLTPFTFSRFLVPHICNYEGWALFLDADILVRGDIAELFRLGMSHCAAHVNMDQPAFEWASAILFNCAHASNKVLTPAHIENPETRNLHKIGWLEQHEIGRLPKEWNTCIGYNEPPKDAKLVHFTQGVPHWWETRNQPYADEWVKYAQTATSAEPWWALMGRSVHAEPTIKRLIATGEIKDMDEYVVRAGLIPKAAE